MSLFDVILTGEYIYCITLVIQGFIRDQKVNAKVEMKKNIYYYWKIKYIPCQSVNFWIMEEQVDYLFVFGFVQDEVIDIN